MRSSCARSRFSLSGSSSRYQPATAPVNLPPAIAPPPPDDAPPPAAWSVTSQTSRGSPIQPTLSQPLNGPAVSHGPSALSARRAAHLVTRPYHLRVRQVTSLDANPPSQPGCPVSATEYSPPRPPPARHLARRCHPGWHGW